MTDIKCLDSSAWLAYYLAENLFVKSLVDGDNYLITSSICIFEVKKKLLLLKKDHKSFLNFIKHKSRIIPLDMTIAEKAAEISVNNELGAVDSLIYATSFLNNSELITGDNDFREMNGVKIIA